MAGRSLPRSLNVCGRTAVKFETLSQLHCARADALTVFLGLLPGDILLCSPAEPTGMQHAVQKSQARWVAKSHARFTHVGI
jgi:hypothetical protein